MSAGAAARCNEDMTDTLTSAFTPTAPFLDSRPVLDDPQELRARLDEHGYLFFSGLLPVQDVLEVRRQILEVLGRYGWLAAGSELMDGIADVEAFAREPKDEVEFCGVGVGPDAYRDIYHLEAFHRLSHHPALLGLYGRLFGAPVLPQPRNIARVMIPTETGAPTPPHQDFIHIQGSKKTMTAWLPLGDCPIDLGGLTTLAGSHKDGVLSYKQAEGAGGLEAYLCEMHYPWAMGDYAAGDVLTFTCETVHRALPNHIPDRIRLSADYRYQPAHDPINDGSLQPHCNVDSWDNIYAGWRDESLKYYWRDEKLQFSPWDESIRWQKDKIC
jgi:hypothetical protein